MQRQHREPQKSNNTRENRILNDLQPSSDQQEPNIEELIGW